MKTLFRLHEDSHGVDELRAGTEEKAGQEWRKDWRAGWLKKKNTPYSIWFHLLTLELGLDI